MDLEKYFYCDLHGVDRSKRVSWGSSHLYDFLINCSQETKKNGGVVLDLGAGHQRYKPFFHESIYIALEHPIAGRQNKNIVTYDILCDSREIPLRDCCVSTVLSTVSFEHLEYPQETINEVYRILRPGGSLWVQVPFIYKEHEQPYDFQRPTRYGLMRHYRIAGFEKCFVNEGSSPIFTGTYILMAGITQSINELHRRGEITEDLVGYYLKIHDDAKRYCESLEEIFDYAPPYNTTIPGQWLSAAFKSGKTSNDVKYSNVSDFMSKNYKP